MEKEILELGANIQEGKSEILELGALDLALVGGGSADVNLA